MELHYKIYRKVKIYFNKVHGALPHLETLKERPNLSYGTAMVVSRIEEMELMQAQLVSFFLDPSLKLPYMPSSRCLALTNWYANDTLVSCGNLNSFYAELTKEDEKVLREAGYIIADSLLPSKLRTVFEEHRDRLKNLRLTKESLIE
ncbi:hypothetical protein [Zobellia alginiliquefaciens]|uniref:hypothetical protein n=1 Tax=Zobellia alginiliquefaciens TaxID=3032586 RepID=UPI0023E12E70|nr:hypothetical protein [Zobellia alginiliquefaciens]